MSAQVHPASSKSKNRQMPAAFHHSPNLLTQSEGFSDGQACAQQINSQHQTIRRSPSESHWLPLTPALRQDTPALRDGQGIAGAECKLLNPVRLPSLEIPGVEAYVFRMPEGVEKTVLWARGSNTAVGRSKRRFGF